MYPYVFVAGPNKHDNLPVSSPSRKLSQGRPERPEYPKDTELPSLFEIVIECSGVMFIRQGKDESQVVCSIINIMTDDHIHFLP